MTSLKEILIQLGFNPDAPESTQQSFLKHLQWAAQLDQKAEVLELNFKKKEGKKTPSPPEQLSFDASLLGNLVRPSKRLSQL